MRRIALLVLIAALTQAGAAWAQEAGGVVLQTTAEIEVEVLNESGQAEIRRVEAAKVIPGDEVIYTIHYKNIGTETADRVTITDPIPDHMIYQSGSASGEGTIIRFSADGGKTYDLPGNLTVADVDGKDRPAKASDYTHIQWSLTGPLAPKAEGSVDFRAVLE